MAATSRQRKTTATPNKLSANKQAKLADMMLNVEVQDFTWTDRADVIEAGKARDSKIHMIPFMCVFEHMYK